MTKKKGLSTLKVEEKYFMLNFTVRYIALIILTERNIRDL